MDQKLFRDSTSDQKCELLKGELDKVNNRLDKIKGNEADKGVSFVLLPFILMFGYNILNDILDLFGIFKGLRIAFCIAILLLLLRIFVMFYNRIK